MIRLLLLLILFVPLPAQGFEIYVGSKFSLSLKGYYKNLFFNSKSLATNNHIIAELNRLRMEWDARFGNVFSTKVIWDNELIAGDFVGTPEFDQQQTERNAPYLDMDYEIVRKRIFFYGQKFYRAYARFDIDPVVLILGRQRIGWGVMRLFTPTDLFTRLSIFDIEKLERIGSTAASLTVDPGYELLVNLAYEFHPDFDRSRIGGRITKTVGRFDLSILGGKFLRDEVVGFDFSGDVKKAGVRGEFVYDRFESGKDFVQFSIGMDYAFENSFYLAFEYFFNGRGTSTGITSAIAATGTRIQSVHQNFVGFRFTYDLMPIWHLMLLNVIDPKGGSLFVNPETKYEVLAWLELMAGVHLPVGRDGGEFTALPNVYYFQLQAFF